MGCWVLRGVQTILYVTFAAALGSNALAQRGFGGPAGAPGLSSTAQGAGATGFPSSTAIGAGAPQGRIPGFSYGFNSGFNSGFNRGGFGNGGGGYYGNRNAGRSHAGYGYGSAGRGRGDYRGISSGYFVSPYYYPFLDYGSAPYGGAPEDVPEDPNPQGALLVQNALGAQVQRLTSEIEKLKSSQQQPAAQAPASPRQPDPPPPPVMPITLVLRDGQMLKVQNFAVMGQTFWDFSKQPVRKIPVSSIDVTASSQATAASGAEFPQITSIP